MKLDRLSLLIGAAGSALVFTVSAGLGLGVPATSAQMPTMDQQVTELRQMASQAHASAQRAQVIAVTYQLDTSGFHDLDERAAAGSLPPGALGRVRRARTAVHATSWPEPLRETAVKLMPEMEKLEAALRDEDVARAAGPAHEVHEIAHQLSDQAYGWLGGGPAPTHGSGQGTGQSHSSGSSERPSGH
jgi:hypothetical protein